MQKYVQGHMELFEKLEEESPLYKATEEMLQHVCEGSSFCIEKEHIHIFQKHFVFAYHPTVSGLSGEHLRNLKQASVELNQSMEKLLQRTPESDDAEMKKEIFAGHLVKYFEAFTLCKNSVTVSRLIHLLHVCRKIEEKRIEIGGSLADGEKNMLNMQKLRCALEKTSEGIKALKDFDENKDLVQFETDKVVPFSFEKIEAERLNIEPFSHHDQKEMWKAIEEEFIAGVMGENIKTVVDKIKEKYAHYHGGNGELILDVEEPMTRGKWQCLIVCMMVDIAKVQKVNEEVKKISQAIHWEMAESEEDDFPRVYCKGLFMCLHLINHQNAEERKELEQS